MVLFISHAGGDVGEVRSLLNTASGADMVHLAHSVAGHKDAAGLSRLLGPCYDALN